VLKNKLNHVMYAFAYFCAPADAVKQYWETDPTRAICAGKQPFEIAQPDPNDVNMYQQVVAFKQANAGIKVILSIGGWNFPSNYYSRMVSTAASRAAFIKSCLDTMQKYGFDGIDIDWEYPNAEPRQDPVQFTCDSFQTVNDQGGQPTDGDNLVLLVKEMRAAFGTKLITVCGVASEKHWQLMKVGELAQYVDYFHLMSYDYWVSDIESANITAPNQPLKSSTNPKLDTVWGTDYTVKGYIRDGVPAEKLVLGLAYYGHSWYVPGLTGNAWQTFGLAATKQGACCGPFKTTYGSAAGEGCSLCGSMMYSELKRANGLMYTDVETSSDIMYFPTDSADGVTTAGTWVSYVGPANMAKFVQYAKDNNLAGVFIFDTSMDSVDENKRPTYELTNVILNTWNTK